MGTKPFVKEAQSVMKTDYDLIESGWMKDVADVLTFGAAKYDRFNWQKAKKSELHLYRSAVSRHFEAYRGGESNDPETGLSHLAHASCNLMFLHFLERKYNDSK